MQSVVCRVVVAFVSACMHGFLRMATPAFQTMNVCSSMRTGDCSMVIFGKECMHGVILAWYCAVGHVRLGCWASQAFAADGVGQHVVWG
jgi:hypothetical protein